MKLWRQPEDNNRLNSTTSLLFIVLLLLLSFCILIYNEFWSNVTIYRLIRTINESKYSIVNFMVETNTIKIVFFKTVLMAENDRGREIVFCDILYVHVGWGKKKSIELGHNKHFESFQKLRKDGIGIWKNFIRNMLSNYRVSQKKCMFLAFCL